MSVESEPRYPFVIVDVSAEESDELAATLFELGASGVEERDDQTLLRGAGAGRVTLVASFSDRAEAEAAVEGLREIDAALAPRIEEVVGDAWRDAWKEHFAPFALTPRITVAPPWVEAPQAPEGGHVLWLEPGRAFGTGLHATTSLVAELLDAHAEQLAGKPLLDVGTGSGILAFVALLLGASRAVAVDNDPDVIEVVQENAARNGLEARVEAREATSEGVKEAFPWVVANIEARVLRPMAEDLGRLVAPGGWLILSGILESEHDEIVARYGELPRGLRHVETRRRGDAASADTAWVAILFAG
ncbi:50S ribosomal protein L11 methyltransferase [Chondromyces apiculatus]|uniref:Ribosomal protein L11 methyltransferase n=1 Tax=Chondromyces apiculatus DSM 436 TaxID=1192034 RepID=A0A017TD73_9BACT|nr:50S ribosomal protein L11 methyltransferase [Chondromyces apiculatus]EYF07184.1 Ribosomal protein L11 methyltransferase [Chondromyces apiculatus DSM 436]